MSIDISSSEKNSLNFVAPPPDALGFGGVEPAPVADALPQVAQLHTVEFLRAHSHPDLRACAEPGLMQLEQRVLQQLPQVQRYALQGGAETPRLVLHFADGSRWEMAGTPTPETRFGAAGERVFLEVAPQRVACNHPLMPQAQCLSVRDVHYGDNGVRQSVGAWRVFHGEIEGYQHEPGMRNVLRLQRYPATRPGQPQAADAPRHVYVLDMVVETERVAP